MDVEDIAQNVAAIRSRIAQACRAFRSRSLHRHSCRRDEDRRPAAYPRGLSGRTCGIFGENYVQEALTKVGDPELVDAAVRWHFIGHLQRNKVRDIRRAIHTDP